MVMSATHRIGVPRNERPDAELLAASASSESFGLLFERHVDAIYSYLSRRVGAQVADELAAETFVRAFEQRSRFVPLHDSAGPWLYGIATNLVRKAWRGERRQLAAYAKTAAIRQRAADDFERADARVDASRASRLLAAALVDLRPGDRDALLLFAWQELTYEEIGVALGIPAGTVASRINRARRHIKISLAEAGDRSMETE